MRSRVGMAALAGAMLLAIGSGARSSAAATAKTWTVRPGGAVAAKPACTAGVNGTSAAMANGVVAVSYANKTGKLTIHPSGGNLHWYHVTGCGTLFGNGDPAALSAAYALSPPQFITSP